MKRVTNGFARRGILHFNEKLQFISSSMCNNPHFPTLQPEVQLLCTEAAAYEKLFILAINGDKLAITNRNVKQQQLMLMLTALGMQVSSIAQNNEAMLISSGFPFTQERKRTVPLSKPKALKVQPGANRGEICCRTSRQPGTISINYYITIHAMESPPVGSGTDWRVISFNRTKYTFKGLTSGQRYYMRVGLVGVRGQEVMSDWVSYIAQ